MYVCEDLCCELLTRKKCETIARKGVATVPKNHSFLLFFHCLVVKKASVFPCSCFGKVSPASPATEDKLFKASILTVHVHARLAYKSSSQSAKREITTTKPETRSERLLESLMYMQA